MIHHLTEQRQGPEAIDFQMKGKKYLIETPGRDFKEPHRHLKITDKLVNECVFAKGSVGFLRSSMSLMTQKY